VNVKGIWNCCKAAVPAMRQAGGGSIVNIASLAATYGMPYGLHYTTSKAAVIGLTRGLARELGRDRIRVNALAPSAVITEGTREFFGAKLDRALDTIKTSQTIQRNLMPSDLVGTVQWLISDASAFVTGQTIAVEGGSILFIASQLGRVGSAGRAAYCATKGALIQLAKVMAIDHAAQNIRVNTLSPGAVETQRTLNRYGSFAAANREIGPKHVLGRLGRPSEIAPAAVHLASEAASFVTGSDLLVDGGYTSI